MKGHAFIAFALALTVLHVDGLYTHKCKEAETSSNQVIRIIENTNCTLVEGGKKLHETVNHLKFTFKLGIDHFKNKFTKPTTKRPGYESLDDAIDVRISSGDDEQPVTLRSKRETTMEEIEPENPGNQTKSVFKCCAICEV